MPTPLPAEAAARGGRSGQVACLNRHVVAEGPVAGGLTFSFPPAFFRQRLYLVGERHGSAAPHVVDLELLTLLNRRANVRDDLAEMDPLQAARINAYLDSGDERALNLRRAAGRRVRFHGLDAIQDWAALAAWLRESGAGVVAAALP